MAFPIIRLRGSRREIGLTQGARIRGLRLPPLCPQDTTFGHECRAIVEKLHPAICVEFDAMLDASGLAADQFRSFYFGRTAPLAGGCTNIAVTAEATEHGHLIVGRNYDWAYADRRWCEARLVSPHREMRRIGYTHHWGGLCDVMNEAGLTICIASLPPKGALRPGVQWHIAVDLVASTCTTVCEAADLLRRVPHIRSLAYLLADGTAARLVEASTEEVTVHAPRDGVLVGTNHRIGDEAKPGERRRASFVRRERALELLLPQTGKISGEEVKRVLADHEGGICAGAHCSSPGLAAHGTTSGTIWSLMAEPHRRLVEVAPGHPCETPFGPIPWS